MADAMFRAHFDQLEQLRVHRDQVDAEIARRERFGGGYLGIEKFGCHRPAGNHAEPARVADRADKMAFGDPAHRTAQDGIVAAEKLGSAGHQIVNFAH